MKIDGICGVCGKDHYPDNKCCPRCTHYNAMLSQWDRVLTDTILKCRDCGYTETIDR